MDDLNEGHDQYGGREPIAVIGMGCRFPGAADSPAAFWELLLAGRDAIGEAPAERWANYRERGGEDAAALRATTRLGGFLPDIHGFDASFFGIPPREATLMDPQQRIALEVSWEALEHAGLRPADLAGSTTGVWFGVNCDDYGRQLLEDLPRIEAWTGIGASLCAVANRVSHALDLRGPSMAVDTACSASLVAVDLACQALQLGTASLAIAGGVMLMAGPGLTMVMQSAGALAPDGRSKSFDAAADGYGRGEGCGVLVLKRLADARRDGDRVLALIRGGAVHQDGRTNGIMAPNGAAQAELYRRSCAAAGVSPDSVDYVEAHGTGTRVGDPIEAGALAEVFGAGRPDGRPCLIGSVKSNIGHLEAASGIAGAIKAVLALWHRTIPPTLHHNEPNPAVDWAASGLRVVTAATPWPGGDRVRRAGVCGYGYGGTLAHLILEEAPPTVPAADVPAPAEDRTPRLFPLSAATPQALAATAARLAEELGSERGDRLPLAAVAHTLTARRELLPERAAVVAADRAQLLERLGAVAAERSAAGVATGRPLPAAADPGAVWVFSGHGSQWSGMGRELLATEPVFAAVLDQLEPVFQAEIGFSPRQALLDGEQQETSLIQPLIFAVQVALAEVWAAQGLRPAAVIGHSVGEIAAAVTAGVFDLADGARLVCRRSRLLRLVARRGSMAMVNLPFEEVSERLGARQDVVAAIAASPRSTVLAGDSGALQTVVDRWRTEDRLHVQRVDSQVAFHSRHMDPLLDLLVEAAETIAPRPPRLRLYTTALDDPRATPVRDGSYWAANLRNPVRFTQAVGAAIDDGYRVFLEISPHPVVVPAITETLAAAGIEDAVVAHTLRRDRPERATMLANRGLLHCAGLTLEPAAGDPATLVDLPTTAWLRQHYEARTGGLRAPGGRAHDPATHTLLGSPVTVHGASPIRFWLTDLDLENRPYPGQHPVRGTEIVPAAVTLASYLTAAGTGALSDIALRVPVPVEVPRTVQVISQDGGLRLSSRPVGDESEQGWLTHSTARAATPELSDRLPAADCPRPLDPGFVVGRLAEVEVASMGFEWRITELLAGPDAMLARVDLPAEPVPGPTGWAALLDAALSLASVVFEGPAALRMPAALGRIELLGEAPRQALVRVAVQPAEAGPDTVDLDVTAPDGTLLARLRDLRYGRPEEDAGGRIGPRHLVHELAWRPLDLPADDTDRLPELVVVLGDLTLARGLGPALTAAGRRCLALDDPAELARIAEPAAVLVAPRPDDSADPQEAAEAAAELLLAAVRQAADGSRIWCLTRGARAATAAGSPAQGALWGLGRVLAGEHPQSWGGIVDLDAHDPVAAAARLVEVLRARPEEDVIALHRDRAEVARLVPVAADEEREPVACRPDASYLITGGFGVLGLRTAHWLAARGARRLILAGRTALPPRSSWDRAEDPAERARIAAVRELEAAGVTVHPIALDIADPAQAARLLDPDALGLPPIRGVVHAAGALDSRLAVDTDRASLRRVLRPKAGGALVLHRLFPPGSLDFLVLFSSAGPLLGLPGQAAYAVANSFLDGLARHRAEVGDRHTVSLAWTSWRGLGMSTSSELIDAELAARGTGDITAAEAFAAWEYAEGRGRPFFAVLRHLAPEPGARRPVLLAEAAVPEPAGEAADQPAWAGLTGAELAEHVHEAVWEQVCAETHLTGRIDPRVPLTEAGLDSVATLIIRRRLERHFGTALPATLLWNRPTVEAISEFITGLLSGSVPEEVAP
ncbi:type I polyketide synthase [Kitasatospora viridis]|uniref:6-methylsalicylic acid synthase n=1 Tax=Kitasatospora viridis TaxID=281105 RepID=A0A561UCE7_9ACTN|nr:type I polyketide synthase [Kitasatospora viridis]TWF97038.1 6-methylsalicylic acid synthase [Kitasatospora viridis]